ncbi:uncharacterized protein F4807DRAFT_414150, partial [Annulohypoxylon truncatum]|uniref:uncharacterized protein n=1 Tax=Annulohypoxylon truncatum TaxID=327061 RepID=UPI00200776DC
MKSLFLDLNLFNSTKLTIAKSITRTLKQSTKMPDTTYPTAQTGKIDADSQAQPASEAAQPQGAKQFAFAAHQAHPGPAIPQNMPEQEGTKEERKAKAQELNK